jgi:hypothetical protein
MVTFADLLSGMGLGSALMVWVKETHTASGQHKPPGKRVKAAHRHMHKRGFAVYMMARPEAFRKTG